MVELEVKRIAIVSRSFLYKSFNEEVITLSKSERMYALIHLNKNIMKTEYFDVNTFEISNLQKYINNMYESNVISDLSVYSEVLV